MSSAIGNGAKNKQRIVVIVNLYSKVYVQTYEVKDFSLDISTITIEVTDLLTVICES